ncbi:MAG: deoxyribose-phosphate aldolase [Minicystis sp.]
MTASNSAPGPVVLGSDHGGFDLKEAIKRHLTARGVPHRDVGTTSKDAVDYPVFARAAAEMVARGEAWRGIVVDGAGIGSGMVANKVPGVRSGMAFDVATAKNAREHNDANVLTLGAGYLSEETALKIVDVFLSTECTEGRHKRRVAMIDALDAGRSLPASASPQKSSSMSSGNSDYESLVQSIMQVLTANPALLAPLFNTHGGAPVHCVGGQCVGCGHCVSKRADTVRQFIGGAKDVRLAGSLGIEGVPQDLARLIDHTLLRPDATYAEIDKLCDEALKYNFASVCVNPVYVKRAAAKLRGATPVVCTVVGFPLGATPSEIKALEARRAIRDGAREIDMVLCIGALKSGDHKYVYDDIRTVAETVHDGRAILKVILETALLTDEEKVAACVAAKKARADFVKTSTGFSKGGATVHDISLMAKAVDHQLGVKASGGVGSAADARKMIEAGATRIGASVGVKIVQEAKGQVSSSAGGSSSKAAY